MMYFKILISFSILFLYSGCVSPENDVKLPIKCYQTGKTGMCRAYFQKFHINQKTGKCEKYVYGGCGEVIFHTLDECKNTCEK